MVRKRMDKLRWGGSVKRKNKIPSEGVVKERIRYGVRELKERE